MLLFLIHSTQALKHLSFHKNLKFYSLNVVAIFPQDVQHIYVSRYCIEVKNYSMVTIHLWLVSTLLQLLETMLLCNNLNIFRQTF